MNHAPGCKVNGGTGARHCPKCAQPKDLGIEQMMKRKRVEYRDKDERPQRKPILPRGRHAVGCIVDGGPGLRPGACPACDHDIIDDFQALLDRADRRAG